MRVPHRATKELRARTGDILLARTIEIRHRPVGGDREAAVENAVEERGQIRSPGCGQALRRLPIDSVGHVPPCSWARQACLMQKRGLASMRSIRVESTTNRLSKRVIREPNATSARQPVQSTIQAYAPTAFFCST